MANICEVGAEEKTSETVSQKIFDELPVPGGKGRIKYAEGVKEISPGLERSDYLG
jgi:hypothetical protein